MLIGSHKLAWDLDVNNVMLLKPERRADPNVDGYRWSRLGRGSERGGVHDVPAFTDRDRPERHLSLLPAMADFEALCGQQSLARNDRGSSPCSW